MSGLLFAPDDAEGWTPVIVGVEISIGLAVGTSLAGLVFFGSRLLQKLPPIPYPGVWLWYLAATLCLLNNSLDAVELLEGSYTYLSPTSFEMIDEDGQIETVWTQGQMGDGAISVIRIVSHWAIVPLYWLPLLLGLRAQKHPLPTRWMIAYGIFAVLMMFGAMTEVLSIRYEYPGGAAALIWLAACVLFGSVYIIDLLVGMEVRWPHFIAILIVLPAAVARTYWAIHSFMS